MAGFAALSSHASFRNLIAQPLPDRSVQYQPCEILRLIEFQFLSMRSGFRRLNVSIGGLFVPQVM
jgi:hypothetical protein